MNTITIRAKAFSTEGVKTHTVYVDESGIVRVYDSVAGHFTACHCLTPAAILRIRRAAGV